MAFAGAQSAGAYFARDAQRFLVRKSEVGSRHVVGVAIALRLQKSVNLRYQDGDSHNCDKWHGQLVSLRNVETSRPLRTRI